MMAKRSLQELEEYDDVSSVDHPSPRAKIHGVITMLSPMKKSKNNCNYFNGELGDGKSTMRVFGYDSNVRRQLWEHHEKDEPVSLSNCQVKTSRDGDMLEVQVGKFTEVKRSEKKFNAKKVTTSTIKMSELQGFKEYSIVTVEVKVMTLNSPIVVPGGLKKQDIIVCDQSGSGKVTVWEDDIDKLEIGKSYCLSDMLVRNYGGNYLSLSKNVSSIADIENITNVIEAEAEEYGIHTLNDVRVVGVDYLDSYEECMKCGSKVVMDKEDHELAECTQCQMIQCRDECKKGFSACLTLKTNDHQKITLRVFNNGHLVDIVGSHAEITRRTLLKAGKFSIHHKDGIIQSIIH